MKQRIQVSIFITEEMKQRIDELAKEEQRTFANMVRVLLDKGLSHYQKQE